MVRVLKGIFRRSVFKPIPVDTPMNDVLAVLFHRLAATVYLSYVLWGIVSLIYGLPSIVRAQGAEFQVLFSIGVIVTAAPSCIGSTFWPVLARLELFSSSGFISLLLLYGYFLAMNVIEHGGSPAGIFLIISAAVMPSCRAVVIVVLLLRQAKGEWH